MNSHKKQKICSFCSYLFCRKVVVYKSIFFFLFWMTDPQCENLKSRVANDMLVHFWFGMNLVFLPCVLLLWVVYLEENGNIWPIPNDQERVSSNSRIQFFHFLLPVKKGFPFLFFIFYIYYSLPACLFYFLNLFTDWSWSKWPQQSFHSTYARVSD